MKGQEKKEKNKFSVILSNLLKKPILYIVVGVVLLGTLTIGITTVVSNESKTTKIGFKDIGELATQSAYTTVVNVEEVSRNILGIQIPFTESKYIYSYDVEVKAGIDFAEIEWEQKGKTIEVKLPEIKVLSSSLDLESFKVYHESNSAFSNIKLNKHNDALKQLQKEAEKEAISNGILEEAKENAEKIVTEFFGQEYSSKEYKIKFIK